MPKRKRKVRNIVVVLKDNELYRKIDYTSNFDLFLLKPNIGIEPFIFGTPISVCCDGTFQLNINDQIDILEKGSFLI
jgi:hypothetical protein